MKEKTKKLILYIALCVTTLCILYGAIKLNENRKNDALKVSDISGVLTEIKYDGIYTHVIENPNTVIYVSNSSESKSDDFEKVFKDVIKQYNLENEIIYINIYNANITDIIYQNAPEIIFYKEGTVSDIVDASTLKTKNDVVRTLKERSIIND